MKFAILNDAHIGPITSGYKFGVQRKVMSEGEKLLKEFVRKMNEEDHPEFIINLGDSIEDVNDKEKDIISYKRFLSLLSPLKYPLYHLIGNHDVRTLPQEEIAKILGYEKMYYSFDRGEYHFIALSFEMTEDHTHDLAAISAQIPKTQIEWLKEDLSKTNKFCIIFVHYGLADDDMKGNFWFEKDPHHAMMGNRKEVRKILEDSGKVKVVISAHQHWNRMKIHNGIPYFTVTSMIENTHNDGIASGANTIIELDSEKINVNVRGNDPAIFEYKFQ